MTFAYERYVDRLRDIQVAIDKLASPCARVAIVELRDVELAE